MKRKNEEKKEKMQTKKNQKQTKNEKTDYCNPSFYRNKRAKRQNENKTKETIRKTNQKAPILLEKKKICLYVRKKILHAFWL